MNNTQEEWPMWCVDHGTLSEEQFLGPFKERSDAEEALDETRKKTGFGVLRRCRAARVPIPRSTYDLLIDDIHDILGQDPPVNSFAPWDDDLLQPRAEDEENARNDLEKVLQVWAAQWLNCQVMEVEPDVDYTQNQDS